MNWNDIPVCDAPKPAAVNAGGQDIKEIHAALLQAARFYDENKKWSSFCQGKGDTCRDIAAKLARFGSFASDKQREFALKLIEWAKDRPKRPSDAQVALNERVNQTAIEAARARTNRATFEAPKLIAALKGLQRLTLGKLELRRKYKTDLFWVIWADACVGKVKDGELVLFPRGAQNEDLLDALKRAEEDPREAIAQSGRETGQCAMCGHLLTDPVSIARGIGPECAGKLYG